MVKREKSNYLIRSVVHALKVLEEFTQSSEELGVTELSKKLNLHKNNVFRILATLETRGYVEQNKMTENYRLGVKALELGQTYIKQMGILRQAKSALTELSKKSGETAYVGIIRGQEAIYLDSNESPRTVRVISRVGLRIPPYCTAIGKVQIAYESDEELSKHLPKEMRSYTPNTITDLKTLKEELKIIREQGYAIDNEEFEEGVKCIGVPIRDYTHRVIGGLSISGPSSRLTDKKVLELIQLIKEVGEKLAMRLGYHAGDEV